MTNQNCKSVLNRATFHSSPAYCLTWIRRDLC